MDDFRLKEYINVTPEMQCRKCGNPLDTLTTITMLCKSCRGKEWSEKSRNQFREKYGCENPMDKREFIDKIRNTMIEKYGVKCAMDIPEFRKKFEDTCKERYGTAYYVNSPDFVSVSSCKSKINEKFNALLVSAGLDAEQEVVKDGKRFDFWIRGTTTFIEIDPTYTHTPAGNHWDTEGLPKDMQLTKTLIAERNGYRCIHVFDWDDWNDIIDLIKPKQTIYARNCEIKEIKDTSYDEFINNNHIQKNCKGTKIALGLYFKDKLVQVMTFGKPRYNNNYQWELLRLCSDKSLNIIGGASKLFKYSVTVLKLTSIISYCDRSKFRGSVYEKMGMKLLRHTIPNEVWSKGSNKITGSLLRQRGFDQLFDTNYGKGTSNEELMIAHGWLPIYDCGQSVFVYGPPVSEIESTEDDPDNLSIDYSAILKSTDKKRERICKFCGLPFTPKSNRQQYCDRPHYMDCPVCGKRYLVTNNENLKRPPVACSYECRVVRTRQTSLDKYGVVAPGNNSEARKKAKKTSQDKYGVDCFMQSEEFKKKSKQTLLDKYGVDNIQKNTEIRMQSAKARQERRIKEIEDKLPLKIRQKDEMPNFLIDESRMQIYVLTERASQEFLNKYGFRIKPKYGKIHLSIGLVDDGILYQVLRFERMKGKIILADFGTRGGYHNPNGYSKLMRFAIDEKGIEEFESKIPREAATDSTIKSLSLTKKEEGFYKVFWITSDGEIEEITAWDNIDNMKEKFDYFTSDYIDVYEFRTQ